MHVLVICLIIFWRCCVKHPSKACVYECSGCKEWKRYPNLIISTPLQKWVVSRPYWLEILHLIIPKLTDASHERKLFSCHNCAPLRPYINKKAILVCSTNYSRSDAFATNDGKNELLLLLTLLLLCYILLSKFETLPLHSPKAATCIQCWAFLKVLTV